MTLYLFLAGGVFTACLVAAAFFLRFRVKTGDPLFSSFSLAFGLFALERLILVLEHAREPDQHPLTYVVRLVGFAVILFAVIKKNQSTA